jgi:hypothetical protein
MSASLSQSLSSFFIPPPERSDPEPVAKILQAAREDFERGEAREALRQLRRAAEVADEAGSDLRAVALARAAADLATEVSGSVAPPAVSPKLDATESLPSGTMMVAAVVAPAATPVSHSPPSNVGDTGAAALRQLMASGRAVKVLVKRSTRDEGLYVVRRAGSDAPTFGTREAVVVLLEPDDSFFE